MSIKGFMKRLGKTLSNRNSMGHEKLTPDEIELKSYEREDYLRGVKKKLYHHRRKKSMLVTPNYNREYGDKPKTIIGGKFLFKDKKKKKEKNMLNQRCVFK
jgi:hypothetical protein